ncbi:MAG: M48 family metalloprotease [Salinivirgaceae bacterium]|nr:M48 family metalloprotease [Salinivirgaceae bacterium]
MRELDPKIKMQDLLARQIFNVLQGSVTEIIRQHCEGAGIDMNLRSVMEGNSLKVSETLLPHFYVICQEVKEKLGFVGNIDFYITGDGVVNAYSYCSGDEQRPHIIEINSGLFNLLNEEELKFVIGHEIGHLINNDATISQLFRFIYPTEEDKVKVPDFLSKRVQLYGQLAELGADRYGYMANENLEACVTAVFKMASGLFLEKMNVSIDTLMAENSKRLEFFMKGDGVSEGTHPVNPIRIRALELFATAKTQTGLTRGMNELIIALQNFIYDDLDAALSDFIASAGIFVSQFGGKSDKNEEEFIVKQLGAYCLFPHKKLKRIEKGDVAQAFNDSVSKVLEISPDMRNNMLRYFIDVAFADGELGDNELNLIYDFGEKLGFPQSEVACAISIKIREDFSPKASGLKL